MPSRRGSASSFVGQRQPGRHHVLHVHHAPLHAQPLPVAAAVPGGPAVVHVDDADAAAGEVGLLQVEQADHVRGGAAVRPHDVGRQFPVRGDRVRVRRRVHQRVHVAPVVALQPDLARHRQVPGLGNLLGLPAQHLGLPGGRVDPHHGQRGLRAAGHRHDRVAVRGHAPRELLERQVEVGRSPPSPGRAAPAACRPGRAGPRAGRHPASRTAGHPAATTARRTPPRPGTAPGPARRPGRPGTGSTSRASPRPRTGWSRRATRAPARTLSSRP